VRSPSHNERVAHADAFFGAVGVQVRDGGNRAYYRPDVPEAVYMPGFDLVQTGPLFRSVNRYCQVQPERLSGVDVARVVKKLALRAGLDAAKYAGHSLRSGHATSAAMAGASERSIMKQTGHRSVQMVRRYIREGTLFRDNSAG
jgi:antirestriction protein ArdC